MSKKNLSALSDIPEEQSASLSVDSLENAHQVSHETTQGDEAADELNCTQDSNVDSPSFHDILSSSRCEAEPKLKSVTAVRNGETTHNLTVAALFRSEDTSEEYKPHTSETQNEVTEENQTKNGKCEKSDVTAKISPSSATQKDKCPSDVPPETTSRSQPGRARSKIKEEHRSKIPVAVRSSSVAARLRHSIERYAHNDSERQPAVPGAEVSDSLHQTAAPAPKVAERCRSHHTIETPKKDFIQLNRRGEFRRAKTYHTLHLERRNGERTHVTTTAPTTSLTAGITSATTTTDDAPTTSANQSNTRAADPIYATGDPPGPSGQAAGSESSPPSPEPSSPANVSEGSSGRRSCSRIPVRAGTPRRRHQSHEAPRSPRQPDHVSPRSPRQQGHVSPRSLRQQGHVSRQEGHRWRQDQHKAQRRPDEGRPELHESRLDSDSSEREPVVPRLRLPCSQLSLSDVHDYRPLQSDVSAPSLLDHRYHGHSRDKDLIIMDNVSSLSLQLPSPRKVHTPPDRIPMPYRHADYQPNLKPYPRQYINLGRLGPDPNTIRARQEKMQKQQQYAEQVAKKNRSAVKQRSQQYSKQQEQQQQQPQSSHHKMADYAKTVPKPKQKPNPPPNAGSKASREASPMSKIRKLLADSALPSNGPPSGKPPTRSNGASPTRPFVSCPVKQETNIPSVAEATSVKTPKAERQVTRQHSVNVPELRPPTLPLPTFDAPRTSALPPKATRRRPGHQPGRSPSVGQTRVASSLSRLRSLTDQLVTGPSATPRDDGTTQGLRRDDSCPTLGATSDMDSDYSTDSLIAASRPSVASMGRNHSSTSPRGRGLFPPPRDAPNCRRPTTRCSRGVGPDRPGAASLPIVEDFFYDTNGGHGECACDDDSCSPPLSPHRRPGVTRGTQSTPMLNETFLVHKNPLVVDIGLPVGVGRPRRSSPRPRLGNLSPDSLVGSPPKSNRISRPDGTPTHVAALQMMRERHLRDKQRVDAIISGSITRM